MTILGFNNNVNINNTASTTIRSSTFNGLSNFTSAAFLGVTLAQGNTFNANANFTKIGTSNDDING